MQPDLAWARILQVERVVVLRDRKNDTGIDPVVPDLRFKAASGPSLPLRN